MAHETKIGITLGDPLGIGPEVVEKALRDPHISGLAKFTLYGSSRPPPFPLLTKEGVRGRSDSGNKREESWAGSVAIKAIREATEAAIRGDIDAIVTAPIHKYHAHLAGFRYPGHTEYLAALTDTKCFRMMMAGPHLRVTLVTIHEPLVQVPKLLTTQKVLETILLTDKELTRLFRIKKPRIAVAALNPHAGEEGLFGLEEKKILLPAIKRAKRHAHASVEGPFPPDTIYRAAAAGKFDAVIAPYHDQGLIPVKLLHFDETVNITLGLPIIRVSVDHGTAMDIAGKGIADPTNMKAAIRMAVDLAHNRKIVSEY